MAQPGHSKACCTVPPIVAEEYKVKGTYIDIEIEGKKVKTYRTGKADSKTAILVIYDIFGFSAQGLQGADILGQEHMVFIPDLFFGTSYSHADMPPDNDERKKKWADFFAGPANIQNTVARIPTVIDQLKSINGNVEKWGTLGYCWGGKIVSLTSGEGTRYTAAAEVHPAMVDPEEAKKIKIPIAMLGSEGESQEDLDAFKAELTGPNHVERFADQVHGWMAARADLKSSRTLEEYIRGYQILLDFFHKHL